MEHCIVALGTTAGSTTAATTSGSDSATTTASTSVSGSATATADPAPATTQTTTAGSVLPVTWYIPINRIISSCKIHSVVCLSLHVHNPPTRMTDSEVIWWERSNTECDSTPTLDISPFTNLADCKQLCLHRKGSCQSMTFFTSTKRCSHYTTACTKTKVNNDATSFRLEGPCCCWC